MSDNLRQIREMSKNTAQLIEEHQTVLNQWSAAIAKYRKMGIAPFFVLMMLVVVLYNVSGLFAKDGFWILWNLGWYMVGVVSLITRLLNPPAAAECEKCYRQSAVLLAKIHVSSLIAKEAHIQSGLDALEDEDIADQHVKLPDTRQDDEDEN